jgi:tetratricopeptide (TPR) repeat protein
MTKTPEWYTGSDSSGRVARGIEATIERMDAHLADESDIDTLGELLEHEQEENWRAFLQGLQGTIHYDLEQIDRARELLEESIARYKPYLDSFDEVLSVFCQSCYTLGTIYFDEKNFEEATPCFLRCLPYMHEVYEEPYLGNVFAHLDICLGWTDNKHYSVVFAEAAAFSRRMNCESMERLMNAYGRLGHMERATEVFQMLSARCQDYEHFDRVLDYAQRNLGESGEVN